MSPGDNQISKTKMRFSERFTFYREHILGLKSTPGRETLAKKSTVSIKTIERWESKIKDNYPNVDNLIKIIKVYPEKYINLNWLIEGKGEPFPNAREEYPEVCEEVPVNKDIKPSPVTLPGSTRRLRIRDDDGLYGKTQRHKKEGVDLDVTEYAARGQEVSLEEGYDFGRASNGLREIYDSQDPIVIPAIEANIRAFTLSVRRERQNQHQAQEIKELKDECDILKEEVEELKKAVMELKKGKAA